MMKWFPWRFIVKYVARAKGFIDPIAVLSRLQRFAQPSEVAFPVELLRLGAVLQARGLMNAQAIQHNLDWIWPYWVERQFDPNDLSFIPRAFSMTHINLTHRNWTAIGVPDEPELPIVDPCGLVTPFYDGWSIDAWLFFENGQRLIPSRHPFVSQTLVYEKGFSVRTEFQMSHGILEALADVVLIGDCPYCRVQWKSYANAEAWLAVSLRPYNPEGVSLVQKIERLNGPERWRVDKRHNVYFSEAPDQHRFSNYHEGDVGRMPPGSDGLPKISCRVGLASAAAYFKINSGRERNVGIYVPLRKECGDFIPSRDGHAQDLTVGWESDRKPECRIRVPDKRFQYLFDAAVKTLILHSPGDDVFPGPFTYKHFWFRDAAFILQAMLAVNLTDRAERILDSFGWRQRPTGYFHSQDGEWDSNGEALWILGEFCRMTGRNPKPAWRQSVRNAAQWIKRKRLSSKLSKPEAGLFPAGFSAEHFGPSDFYFWDDFWGVAGLRSAAELLPSYGEEKKASEFEREAVDFLKSIFDSLESISKVTKSRVMQASPYRRMDSACIGSLAVDYPLKLWEPGDPRVLATVEYLLENCFLQNAFFHDMSHSGINPYLTLHVAEVLLRAGDPRFFEIVKSVASLASPTGQWPEAIHPQTKGGCMGDGQHVWASAEWVVMMRNLFVREEKEKLILFSGIPSEWLASGEELSCGMTLTGFGAVTVKISKSKGMTTAEWDGQWRCREPVIEIRLPGHEPVCPRKGQTREEFHEACLP